MPTAKKQTAVKKVKKTPAVKAEKKTAEAPRVQKLEEMEIAIVGIDGKAKGKMSVPKELFKAPVNAQLLAQAVRVYLANQRVGGASTKTRGEVEGSTRKIYRQKGTGRARHGGIRAPIFVGGGIVFGPLPRDYRLNMPSKMRKTALVSAMTKQFSGKNIIVVDGMEDLEPKTKKFAAAFAHIGAAKKTLFVVPKESEKLFRATRNITNIDSMPVVNVHAYAVISHDKVVFTKTALKNFIETQSH